MAGYASATNAQVLTLRDNLTKTLKLLEKDLGVSCHPATANAAELAAIDAAVDALVLAIAPVNT